MSVQATLALAADIRRFDGNHDLGAAALAERLVEAGWTKADWLRKVADRCDELDKPEVPAAAKE